VLVVKNGHRHAFEEPENWGGAESVARWIDRVVSDTLEIMSLRVART
jgi:hypothetical protein